MAEEKNTSDTHVMNSNDLAFERTILAENRTLMAWIRTAISMISFGFTIYKFFHESGLGSQPGQFFTPRKVGMIMIGFGLLALVWGLMDHVSMFNKLKSIFSNLPSIVWVVLLPLGLAALIGGIILIFFMLASVEGFASILILVIGFLVVRA